MTGRVEGRAAALPRDPLAEAAIAVAWLIVANKPIYPLYVWWFAGSGVLASCWTMLAAPAFLALALIGRRRSLVVRVGLPLVGLVDTLFATRLFGPASGTELFLMPCLLLAVSSFRAEEARWARGLVAILWVAFVAAHGRLGDPLHVWSPAELERLLAVDVFAVASLCAFIGWRFAGLPR